MRLYVRPTFDRTPLVKITKPKLLELRTSLKEREEPIGNAEDPLELIRDLEVTERPFLLCHRAA